MTPKGIIRRAALARTSSLGMAGILAAACGAGAGQRGQGPVAPAASKPQGTVTFWHNWTTRGPLLRTYLDQIEHDNPGLKIEDTEMANSGGRVKAAVSLASGAPPDCLHVFNDMLPQLVPARLMRDLKPLMARDKVDPKLFYDAELAVYTFANTLITLPATVAANAQFVWWNKDLFRRAGLDPEQGPRTWSQAQEMALKLTRREGDGFTQLGFDPGVPPAESLGGNEFIRWLYHNGGTVWSDDARKVTFNSPAGIETLEWLQQTVTRQGSYAAAREVSRITGFLKGTVAMLVGPDNTGSQLMTNPQGQSIAWGVSLLPINDRNAKAKVQTPAVAGHGYGVPRDAKNVEGGWLLTKTLTATNIACSFITKEQLRFSPLRQCAEIAEVKDRPEFKVFTAAVQAGVNVPPTSASVAIAALLAKATTAVLSGQNSAKDALDNAAREAQVELDKAVAQGY